ncbi:hypothetical protein TanjilG_22839 [Lupinus angustifolius]|uniref:Uncharacterized protein n=1 Tax=Lupinus angustifolius TaxID=3871 RepID=A0A4P1RHY6_LUPAN|nr:hypothetical protein TanjilG_22839 [Lupinus angustifolius]
MNDGYAPNSDKTGCRIHYTLLSQKLYYPSTESGETMITIFRHCFGDDFETASLRI